MINKETSEIQNILFNKIRSGFCRKLTMKILWKVLIIVSLLSRLKRDIKRINQKQVQTIVDKLWNILKIYFYFNIATRGGIL